METKPSFSDTLDAKQSVLSFQLRKVFKKNTKSMAAIFKILLNKSKDKTPKGRS